MTGVGESVARLVRDEGRRVLATLVRLTGDVSLAEDAVQDAVVRALETWPRDGVPPNPRAWLTLTARRRAIDLLRREAGRWGKEERAVVEHLRSLPDDGAEPEHVVRDDLARLVFTCCHPSLAPQAQVELALRTLCGLTTAEIARVFLVPEATLAKRLTRTRQKITAARIPYRVPGAAELPDRVQAVAAVVYLLFTEGYAASGGADLVRASLTDEALRLARLLVDLMPDEPSLTGLLALLLLQDARRETRLGPDGELALMAAQDRSRWDRAAITEGVELVGRGLGRTRDRPDRYVVQAAIAACHVLAASAEVTDWRSVVEWYDVLVTVYDTPVVRLNRAVALGERDGPQAGLEAVEAVDGLAGYPWWHASRAELLHRLDRDAEAVQAYDAALAAGVNAAQARHLRRRRDGLGT